MAPGACSALAGLLGTPGPGSPYRTLVNSTHSGLPITTSFLVGVLLPSEDGGVRQLLICEPTEPLTSPMDSSLVSTNVETHSFQSQDEGQVSKASS